jgi:UDP-N-acetylmuramyl pentapeptide synthase
MTGTQSPRSFNNHLGVPLTLLSADPAHDFLACEIGTNHPGEIDALASIVRPDIALITSIGAEHLEFFGDLDGVAREEAALLPHVKPGGAVFVEADAAVALAPYYDVQEGVTLLPVRADRFAAALPDDLPLAGPHQRANAALVAAAARWLDHDDATIAETMRSATPSEGRMQLLTCGNAQSGRITVIHDAYNANPDSTAAALDWFEQQPRTVGRGVLIFGDMRELGDAGPAAHRAVGQRVSSMSDVLAAAYWIGPLAAVAGEACLAEAGSALDHRFFVEMDPPAAEAIAADLRPGDRVLLKGSRGLQLERILPHLRARFGPPVSLTPRQARR